MRIKKITISLPDFIAKFIGYQRFLWLFAFIIFGDIGTTNAQTNLLKNNSFEETMPMYNNIFPEWLCHNNANVVKSNDYHLDGNYSAKMSSREIGSTAIINQVVEVRPNSIIRIRHHYFISKWKDKGARMYCYFRERSAESSTLSNDYIKQYYDENTIRIIRGGGYGLTYFPHTLNKWLTFDEEIMVPPDAHYFVFEIHSFYGTTIYVDDCYVGQEIETDVQNRISDSNEIKREYYSLNGIRLKRKPQKGNYIVRTIDSKGHYTSEKIIEKR